MPTAQVNGVALFYEQKGTGQPVIFVHGILCDYKGWDGQTDALSSRYTTLAYSRRYSQPNVREGDMTDSTVQNNATDLEALMSKLGITRAHLVGHSYGGYIAAYFATKHPDRLLSLTLVNAAVGTMLVKGTSALDALSLLFKSPSVAASARKFLNGTNAAIKAIDSGDQAGTVRVFLPALENGRTDLPRKSEQFDQMAVDNAKTVKETKAPFPTVTKKEAMGIRTPTLVMWGELSAPWDSKISQSLADAIPNCETAKIPGAGHFCLNEKPSEVNRILLSFLQKHG